MNVFVVTNVEFGWDCVCGVFLSFESLKDYFIRVKHLDAELYKDYDYQAFEVAMMNIAEDYVITDITAV